MNPPLFIAAQYNRIDMIERLLSAGHHINQQNYLGKLWYTIGWLTCFNLLVCVIPLPGETALMFAARENKFRAVSTLLRWGAQFDIRDLEGTTAADFTLDREISTLITQYATLPPALIHSQQLKEDNWGSMNCMDQRSSIVISFSFPFIDTIISF